MTDTETSEWIARVQRRRDELWRQVKELAQKIAGLELAMRLVARPHTEDK